MKQLLTLLLVPFLTPLAKAENVPVVPAVKTYAVSISPAANVEYHTISWVQDGSVVASISLLAEGGALSRELSVSLGNASCVDVAVSNVTGRVCGPPVLTERPPPTQ